MKKTLAVLIAVFALSFYSCSTSPTGTELSAEDFLQKTKDLPAATLIDVRTPEEFSKGHLINAKNIDWDGDDFAGQVSTLDKSKPVLVYCLSGGRSSAAAAKMRSDGFKEVYELQGGLMKWRAANIPETTEGVMKATGMTKEQFDALIKSDKMVLVDFYADWCEPCKKMKPYLDDISKDMADKVTVVRINADDNQDLCRELKIDALPVLKLYKNQALSWSNTGYIGKDSVLMLLK